MSRPNGSATRKSASRGTTRAIRRTDSRSGCAPATRLRPAKSDSRPATWRATRSTAVSNWTKTYRFGVAPTGRKGSSEIVYAPALELEDLTSPGIAFVGESTATESCIAFRYAPRNTAQARNVSCGICWSCRPYAHRPRTCGRRPGTRRHAAVMQVISNVLLEYGRPYRFRAYVRADPTRPTTATRSSHRSARSPKRSN